MHIEILTEDSSGKALLEHLLPKLAGPQGDPHSWRIIKFDGVGHIPPGMRDGDPKKRTLLNKLPAMLRSYGRQQNIDAVVVVLDADNRDCVAFLAELQAIAEARGASGKTMFRLAIEEIEAWFLGDNEALAEAYPNARLDVIKRYEQDSLCGTWELLTDAIHDGGVRAIQRVGWPLPGQIKHAWANRLGPLMDPEANVSPSFARLRDGVRHLTKMPPSSPKLSPIPT
jgi:hypothetical protein